MVPADARVVLSADLRAVRSSPFERFLRDTPIQATGDAAGCDRDAFDRADHLALWIPGDTPDQFGVAATGAFASEALLACARTTIAKRGGTPAVTIEGEFSVVGDDTLGADAARIAIGPAGLVLIGRPSSRTRMAAVRAGRTPSAADQGEHARMRAELGTHDVVFTVVVDASVKAAARRYVDQELPMLDGVRGLGVAVDAAAMAKIEVAFWCEPGDACVRLQAEIEARRSAMARSLPLRAVGVAGLAEATTVLLQGSVLRVSVEVPADQVVALIDRLSRLGASGDAMKMPADEVLPAPGGSK